MTKKLPVELKETRRPIHTACAFCHEKHLQCDVGRPCQNCIKRNIALLCRDKVKKRRKRSVTDEQKNSAGPELIAGTEIFSNNMRELPDSLIADVSGLEGHDNLDTQWKFGSMWANNEYMKLEDFTGLVSEVIPNEPVTVDEWPLQMVAEIPRKGSSSSHMFQYLDSGSMPRRSDSRPYISLDMVQTGSNGSTGNKPSGSEEVSPQLHQYGQESALTPFRLRQLIKTPKDLFDKSHLIKPHNYREAYKELLHSLHKMFLGNYYDLQNGKWVPCSDDEVQKRDGWVRREQLQHIAKSIGERYMPMFVALTSNMIEEDLLLQEVTLQRTLLELENMSILVNCTPICIWRRSGEILYVSNEFCSLTGFCKRDMLDGRKFIVEFMDHQSILEYYDLFHDNLAFGPKEVGKTAPTNDHAVYGECNLLLNNDAYLKCACCLTTQRDNFNISLLVIGQFLPIFDAQ